MKLAARLCLFALAWGTTSLLAPAISLAANSDIGPGTTELRSDQIKFQIIPATAQPPASFEQTSFDDSGFSVGAGPFGSGGACSLQHTTFWPTNTQLITRRLVSVLSGTQNLQIRVSIDNDLLGVFFNGTRIGGPIRHEGCARPDEFLFDVDQSLVAAGENLIAFDVLDRGFESFFDARVFASVPPDQLAESVVIQQSPLVPLSGAAAVCRFNPESLGRNTIIPYVVAATGEFGQISAEQSLQSELTIQTFLSGTRTAVVNAAGDTTTASRSFSFAEGAGTDPGILSPSGVFASQRVLDGMIQCNGATLASSCEDVCNRAELVRPILSGLTPIFSSPNSSAASAATLSSAAEANAAKRLADLKRQCLAGCMQTPPVPPRWCVLGDPPPCPQQQQTGALTVVYQEDLTARCAVPSTCTPFPRIVTFQGDQEPPATGVLGPVSCGLNSLSGTGTGSHMPDPQTFNPQLAQIGSIMYTFDNVPAQAWRIFASPPGTPEEVANKSCPVVVPAGGSVLVTISHQGLIVFCGRG